MMTLHIYPGPNSQNHGYVTLEGQTDFVGVIKLRTLKWGVILDYLGELYVITSPSKWKQEAEDEVTVMQCEDSTSCCQLWWWRKRGMSQECIEKDEETDSPEPPERNAPCKHLDFSPGRLLRLCFALNVCVPQKTHTYVEILTAKGMILSSEAIGRC